MDLSFPQKILGPGHTEVDVVWTLYLQQVDQKVDGFCMYSIYGYMW